MPLKLPAGTPIDVESAYTVSSIYVKPGELLSFRVLIPVTVDGVVVIDKGALVTARVTVAKRGGHWGKAGRLSWSMQDVLAVDNTARATRSRKLQCEIRICYSSNRKAKRRKRLRIRAA